MIRGRVPRDRLESAIANVGIRISDESYALCIITGEMAKCRTYSSKLFRVANVVHVPADMYLATKYQLLAQYCSIPRNEWHGPYCVDTSTAMQRSGGFETMAGHIFYLNLYTAGRQPRGGNFYCL